MRKRLQYIVGKYLVKCTFQYPALTVAFFGPFSSLSSGEMTDQKYHDKFQGPQKEGCRETPGKHFRLIFETSVDDDDCCCCCHKIS